MKAKADDVWKYDNTQTSFSLAAEVITNRVNAAENHIERHHDCISLIFLQQLEQNSLLILWQV
jgi:hypothetical protein